LQCVAVCCSVLQCVAVCCSVLQCVAVCCSVLQCVAVCCMQFRPTQSIMYVPFLVSRFQEFFFTIQYKYINLVRRIRYFAQDYAVLVLLLNMLESFISARSYWSGRNDLSQLGTSPKGQNSGAGPYIFLLIGSGIYRVGRAVCCSVAVCCRRSVTVELQCNTASRVHRRVIRFVE